MSFVPFGGGRRCRAATRQAGRQRRPSRLRWRLRRTSTPASPGTRRRGIATALSPTDGTEGGIRGLKIGCGADTGRAIATVPRRRPAGPSPQRARDAAAAPCAAIPARGPGRSRHRRLGEHRAPAPFAAGLTPPLPAAGRTAAPVRQPGPAETRALRPRERGRAGPARGRAGVRAPDTRRAPAAGGLPIHPRVGRGDPSCAPAFTIRRSRQPPVFRERRRIQHDPIRLTRPAGEGKSARGAPASARLRNATRCCTGAASPRRSFRCAFGSARRPRCRPGHGSRASPPTD